MVDWNRGVGYMKDNKNWYEELKERYFPDSISNKKQKNIECLVNFIKKHKRTPSKYKKEEKRLCSLFFHYYNPTDKTFDANFKKEVDLLLPKINYEQIKDDIINFIKKNNRKPSRISQNLEEKRLCQKMNNLVSKHRRNDIEFRKQIEMLIPTETKQEKIKKLVEWLRLNRRRPKYNNNKEKPFAQYLDTYRDDIEVNNILKKYINPTLTTSERLEECFCFIQKHKRKPSASSKNPKERLLAHRISTYSNANNKLYNLEFKLKLEKMCPKVDIKPINKKNIIKFIKKHKRYPLTSSTNITEKSLATSLSTYIGGSHKNFDHQFKKEVTSLIPRGRIERLKYKLIQWIKKHKRLPKYSKGSIEENRAYNALYRFTRKTSKYFDPSYLKLVEKLLKNNKERL